MKSMYAMVPLALMSMTACSGEKTTKHPNVLFISVDDLNDWVGVLGGHPQVKTPNIDRLFASGVTFTNAHAAQPVSTASRNCLLSGLHPSSTGWYMDTKTYRTNYDEVMEGNMMLPEYFKNHGYESMAVGKVFHSGYSDFPGRKEQYWSECAPVFWDEMEAAIEDNGYGYRGMMFYPFPKGGGQFVKSFGADVINEQYRNTKRFYSLASGPLDKEDIPGKGMYDEQIAAWAVNKLKAEHKKPFFMAVGFIRPHVPYTAPKRYFDMYDPDTLYVPQVPEGDMSDIPNYGKAMTLGACPHGDWYDVHQTKNMDKELVHGYLACITFVDEQIGKVIDALKESGQYDNTIIVLFGDHGQHLGEKCKYRKQCLWEESTRVPLFIRIPENTQVGGKTNIPVTLLDLYPTLVEACNLPSNQRNEGSSLVKFVKDVKNDKDTPAVISWYYKNFAIRSKDWRYIQYRDGSEELYDHRSDPGEHNNLASDPQYKDIIAWHKSFIPKNPALPSGWKTEEKDTYELTIERWEKRDSIPVWLR